MSLSLGSSWYIAPIIVHSFCSSAVFVLFLIKERVRRSGGTFSFSASDLPQANKFGSPHHQNWNFFKNLENPSNTVTFPLLPSLSLHSQTQSKRKNILCTTWKRKKNFEDLLVYSLKKNLGNCKLIFDKMLGIFLVNLIFFLTRGSHSLTLLSCNSDAQANDNVNSDVKVSTIDPHDMYHIWTIFRSKSTSYGPY